VQVVQLLCCTVGPGECGGVENLKLINRREKNVDSFIGYENLEEKN